MRTTLDIDKDLLAEAAKVAGEKSLSAAVNKALAEYVRRRKLDELRSFIGGKHFIDNWREMEELELQEYREQFG